MNLLRAPLPLAAGFWMAAVAASSGQLQPGNTSRDTPWSLFDAGGALTSSSLSQFEGKVILAYYYTPW